MQAKKIIRFPGKSGEYVFLSNFYKMNNPVEFDCRQYLYVENAYVAAMSRNPKTRDALMYCLPSEAKRLGDQIKQDENLLNPKWSEEYAEKTLLGLVMQKFKFNTHINPKVISLRRQLLWLRGCQLVYENRWHDNFLGICVCRKCRSAKIEGKNILGKILETVRDHLDK